MFLRQHNLIAQQIRHHNRTLSDERIFKMARKINTALYRRIVFTEWAPVVIGQVHSKDLVKPIESDFTNTNNIRRGVSNEYASAASRFYYSMMPGDLQIVTEQVETNKIVRDDE